MHASRRFNFLVTSLFLLCSFSTVSVPAGNNFDKTKIALAGRLQSQLQLPEEHANWRRKEKLLEEYLPLVMKVGTDSWGTECDELVQLYRQHGDLKKARRLAEAAYQLSKVSSWRLAEIAEEDGDPRRAETLLREDIARFERQNSGKLLETNVRPWYVAPVVGLANFYYRQRRFQDAENIYKKLAEEHPYFVNEKGEKVAAPNPDDQYRLAVFYLDQGKIAVAKKIFAKVLEYEDTSPGVMLEDHYLSYLALLKLRDPDQFKKLEYLAEHKKSASDSALWGVIDKRGHFVILPNFEALGWFDNGLAPAQLANRWGYIDIRGNWKIFPQYSTALPFSESLASVGRRFKSFPLDEIDKQFEGLSFIDENGLNKLRIKMNFSINNGSLFREGLAGISLDSGANDCGYIDKSGKIVIAGQFCDVPPFKNGIAKPSIAKKPITVDPRNDEYQVVISKSKRISLTPKFDRPIRPAVRGELINPFATTSGAIKNESNSGARKWGYLALDGTIVIKPTFDEAKCYSEAVAAVRVKERWGYIDIRGKFVLPPIYDTANDFIDGLAIVKDENKTHFIDHSGRDPFVGAYNQVKEFSAGRAAVSTDGGMTYSLVDRKGAKIVDTKFYRLERYASNLAPAQPVDNNSSLWGFIDLNGQFVIPPTFDQVDEFHGDLATVRCQQSAVTKLNR